MQRLALNFGPQARYTEDEFNRLFLDHYSQITAAAFRLVGDTAEAEELASEAFWKLWQKPPASTENIRSWLYRVVINLGYNRLRSSKRRSVHEEDAVSLSGSAPANPLDDLERKQERQRVRAALAELPERDVQMLLLHALGSSYKEIAETLALKPNSIGTTLARAERKFENLYTKGDAYAPER